MECQGRQRTDVRTCAGTNGQTEATRTHCDGLRRRPALFPSRFSWYSPGHCHSPCTSLVSHFPSRGPASALLLSLVPRPGSNSFLASLRPSESLLFVSSALRSLTLSFFFLPSFLSPPPRPSPSLRPAPRPHFFFVPSPRPGRFSVSPPRSLPYLSRRVPRGRVS